MKELRYTLLTDGSSDDALLPLLNRLIQDQGVTVPIAAEWADLRRLPKPPRRLPERIITTLSLYPADLLFVHRDAEKESLVVRRQEIQEALQKAGEKTGVPPVVCVVPVRMTEAWLLFDELAVRRAAGNRNGKNQLDIPHLKELEDLPDPKAVLYENLREASGLSGRRRKSFSVSGRTRRVAEFINSVTPLRSLASFQAFEKDLQSVLKNLFPQVP